MCLQFRIVPMFSRSGPQEAADPIRAHRLNNGQCDQSWCDGGVLTDKVGTRPTSTFPSDPPHFSSVSVRQNRYVQLFRPFGTQRSASRTAFHRNPGNNISSLFCFGFTAKVYRVMEVRRSYKVVLSSWQEHGYGGRNGGPGEFRFGEHQDVRP